MVRDWASQGHSSRWLPLPSEVSRWGRAEVPGAPPEGRGVSAVRQIAVWWELQDPLPLSGTVRNPKPSPGPGVLTAFDPLERDPTVSWVSLGDPLSHVQEGGAELFLGPLGARSWNPGRQILRVAVGSVHGFPSLPGFAIHFIPNVWGGARVAGLSNASASHRVETGLTYRRFVAPGGLPRGVILGSVSSDILV